MLHAAPRNRLKLSGNLAFGIVFFGFLKKFLTCESGFDKLFKLVFYRKETGKWHALYFPSLSEPLLAVVLARLLGVGLFPGSF